MACRSFRPKITRRPGGARAVRPGLIEFEAMIGARIDDDPEIW
jgi:hypothetical protein